MKRRKLTALMLAMVMVVALFAGCGNNDSSTDDGATGKADSKTESGSVEASANFNEEGLPIVNETITFTAAARQREDQSNFNDMQFFVELEEMTNVHIDWTLIDTGAWEEKKSLMLNSGDLPDFFYGISTMSAVDAGKYGSQGLLIPLNDLIDEYGTYMKPIFDLHPEYLAQVTSMDGNIYALPAFSAERPIAPVAQFINKDWLEAVGMEVPTTVDELTATLKAFKDAGDLNGNGDADEWPLAFQYGSWRDITTMFGAFGLPTRAAGASYLIQDHDTIKFVPMDDSYKEAIMWLNELYEYGCIDPESFTYSGGDYTAKTKADNVGMVSTWTVPLGDDSQWAVQPLVTDGNGDANMFYAKFSVLYGPGFMITKDCEDPAAAMRWADLQYEEDLAFQAFQGMYGSTAELREDGTIRYFESDEYADGAEFEIMRNSTAPGVSSIAALTPEKFATAELAGGVGLKFEVDEYYKDTCRDEVTELPPLTMTEEEQEIVTDTKADLTDYVQLMSAKWITEGGIEEEWDEFIAQLEAMNVEGYVASYQTAYDRFASAQ